MEWLYASLTDLNWASTPPHFTIQHSMSERRVETRFLCMRTPLIYHPMTRCRILRKIGDKKICHRCTKDFCPHHSTYTGSFTSPYTPLPSLLNPDGATSDIDDVTPLTLTCHRDPWDVTIFYDRFVSSTDRKLEALKWSDVLENRDQVTGGIQLLHAASPCTSCIR